MLSEVGSIQPDLASALKDLSLLLAQRNVSVHLRVIGAFALQLLGIDSSYTVDIDVIDDIEDSVRQAIAEIGKKHKLAEDWINYVASNVDLPQGFNKRMETITLFPAIVISFPCRQDIISLKARAFIHRGAKDPADAEAPRDLKDLDDLTKLAPTKTEIDIAIDFIRHTSCPPEPQFFPDFEDYIEVLRHVAR
jgi:Nucleotidyltransferase of unknown function (DUF6036)